MLTCMLKQVFDAHLLKQGFDAHLLKQGFDAHLLKQGFDAHLLKQGFDALILKQGFGAHHYLLKLLLRTLAVGNTTVLATKTPPSGLWFSCFHWFQL